MSAVLSFEHKIETITCSSCGIVYGLPYWFQKCRRDDKQTFYCPNGHPQAYIESETDRLRKQLEQEKRSAEWWKNHAASKDSQLKGVNIQLGKMKAKLKRTETRVSNGVCPCCNRSFQNVMRHMKTKHPDYVEGAK